MNRSFQTIITAAGTVPNWDVAGYVGPKNLTLIDGKELVSRATESYACPGCRTIIAVPDFELLEFQSQYLEIAKSTAAAVIPVNPLVKGALVTALISANELDLNSPLVIAPGDSFMLGGAQWHIENLLARDLDAGTICFESTGTRWSYVALNEGGQVTQVAEKRVIGQHATTGVFVFKTAEIFVRAAEWCLLNKIQTNDSFYVSSTLNYIVSQGGKVGISETDRNLFKYFSRQEDWERQAL